jgi:hypothetical protein
MTELTGAERAKLKKALAKAFSQTDMDMFTNEYFGFRFFDEIPGGPQVNYEYQVFKLIEHFTQRDILPDLVAAARERRPKNRAIADIAEILGLTVTGPRFDTLPGQPARPLEEIVQRNAKFIDPAIFRERLGPLEGQVCWLAFPGGRGGTAFLVGPDLILTNHHVVDPLIQSPGLASQVLARFDYKQTVAGKPITAKQVTEVRLAANDQWWVDGSPPSKKDWDAALGDAGVDELDFTLLRLATRVGDDPVGGASNDPDVVSRGWIEAMAAGVAPEIGEQVFLLQHPKGEPLRLSVGTITAYNGNKTRVRYDANSRDGSSGSPCFNADLQLCALHHAHDTQKPPRWNQAVPIAAIVGRWHYPEG